jgi:hypothetical protein
MRAPQFGHESLPANAAIEVVAGDGGAGDGGAEVAAGGDGVISGAVRGSKGVAGGAGAAGSVRSGPALTRPSSDGSAAAVFRSCE